MSKFVVYLHNLQELRDFEDMYVGNPVVIGDIYYFNNSMRQRLLKFLESNPQIDCYSSYDITDPILLSRFVEVRKTPIEYKAVELGDVVNYYNVLNGTTYTSEMQLHYMNHPELRNFISACQSE